jgi:hypothetical protein
MDYTHFNPVKHGLVVHLGRLAIFLVSSFRRCVDAGLTLGGGQARSTKGKRWVSGSETRPRNPTTMAAEYATAFPLYACYVIS